MKSNLKFSTMISIGFVIQLATFLAACPGPHDDDEPRNTAPVADAGPDQAVAPDTTVQLDGSGSSHDDGDTLTYRWVLESKPENSEAGLEFDEEGEPVILTLPIPPAKRTRNNILRFGTMKTKNGSIWAEP